MGNQNVLWNTSAAVVEDILEINYLYVTGFEMYFTFVSFHEIPSSQKETN